MPEIEHRQTMTKVHTVFSRGGIEALVIYLKEDMQSRAKVSYSILKVISQLIQLINLGVHAMVLSMLINQECSKQRAI